MMNRFAFANQQQKSSSNNALVSGGEMMNGVVCPKPRRLRLLNPSVNECIVSASPSRSQHNSLQIFQTEMRESKARTELIDMILTKVMYSRNEDDQVECDDVNNLVSSSPPSPFLFESPPNRASNPLVQDVLFGKENPNPFSRAFEGSPSSVARGSCARGQKHPTVRVVGFKSRGISAVA